MIDARLPALTFVFAACAFGAAQAHDTYMLPPKFVSASPVLLPLTSVEKFPNIEYGPKKSRIAKTGVDGPDASAKISVASESKTALNLQLKARKPGTYVAAVALSPHDIDLSPDQVAHYFKEIDAPPDLRAAYEAMPEPRRWKETYTKYAKTVVCVDACATLDALARPLGHKLEFVAVAETLGDPRPKFRLLGGGAGLRGAAVGVFRRDGARTVLQTDERGDVALPAGLSGPVLLAAVVIAAPAKKGGRFTSDFATLTFDATSIATPHP
jgi:hypothetical protein